MFRSGAVQYNDQSHVAVDPLTGDHRMYAVRWDTRVKQAPGFEDLLQEKECKLSVLVSLGQIMGLGAISPAPPIKNSTQ